MKGLALFLFVAYGEVCHSVRNVGNPEVIINTWNTIRTPGYSVFRAR